MMRSFISANHSVNINQFTGVITVEPKRNEDQFGTVADKVVSAIDGYTKYPSWPSLLVSMYERERGRPCDIAILINKSKELEGKYYDVNDLQYPKFSTRGSSSQISHRSDLETDARLLALFNSAWYIRVYEAAVEHGTAALEKMVFAKLEKTGYELDNYRDGSGQAELFAGFYNSEKKTGAKGRKLTRMLIAKHTKYLSCLKGERGAEFWEGMEKHSRFEEDVEDALEARKGWGGLSNMPTRIGSMLEEAENIEPEKTWYEGLELVDNPQLGNESRNLTLWERVRGWISQSVAHTRSAGLLHETTGIDISEATILKTEVAVNSAG